MIIGFRVTVAMRFAVTTMVSIFCTGIAGAAKALASIVTLKTAQPNKLVIMPMSFVLMVVMFFTMISVGFDVVFVF